MIVVGLILAVPLGLAIAVFVDWGGHRRLARRARQVARIRSFSDTRPGSALVDDLAGRVKELV